MCKLSFMILLKFFFQLSGTNSYRLDGRKIFFFKPVGWWRPLVSKKYLKTSIQADPLLGGSIQYWIRSIQQYLVRTVRKICFVKGYVFILAI